ncbi:MAG: response regulator [Deltaproteobacteria bacterium]|nr:response regulator [Deltaproteobacteria bacterium]MBW1819272.1 response regulator [Deltaproteobacteria bacterium]
MESDVILKGKRVLLVDDEPDVLETLEEDLDMCRLSSACSYKEARELLEKTDFDIAVLDIMGVDGYRLLDIAGKRNVISIMLTAHALSPEHAVKSHQKGAASYVPKGKINEVKAVLVQVLEAKEKGGSFWSHWYNRFGTYFERKFGAGWVSQGEFWKEVHVGKWEKYF